VDDRGLLESLLAKFKTEESSFIHTTVMLAGDRDSQKILSTWSMLPLVWRKPHTYQPEDIRDLWDWLWAGVVIDWDVLSQRTGLSPIRVKKLYEPLRANRLMYPDGTLPDHALAVLRAEVMKSLPKRAAVKKDGPP
jgi:hypothetical protein